MDIGWGTLVALLALAPGFAFHAGLFSHHGVSRETRPRSFATELLFLILGAAAIHALLLVLYAALAGLKCGFFDVKVSSAARDALGCLCDTSSAKRLTENCVDHAGLLLFHFVASLGLGFVLGRWGGAPLIRGPFRGLIRHAWVYSLAAVDGKKTHYSWAYVLTKTTHEGRSLCYRGALTHFGLDDDGKFTYVVLSAPARFYLKLESEGIHTTPAVEIGQSRHSQLEGVAPDRQPASKDRWIHIGGEAIENVVFTRAPGIITPRKAKELGALLKKLDGLIKGGEDSPKA